MMPTVRKIANPDALTNDDGGATNDHLAPSMLIPDVDQAVVGNKDLPPGWTWTTLENIAELVGGGTPSREVPEYFAGDIVWLTPTEIPKDRVSVMSTSRERITREALQKSSARLVPKGTVLMTSRASIGYVAIAGTDVTTNQGFASFICSPAIFNFYLAYWLWTNAEEFEQQATGTTFKEISKAKLRPNCLPLPPLAEQHRIVEAIEQQLTRLDAGVRSLKDVQARLRRYKAAVLKAACEGRLVPQDPSDEPAGALLRRILDERRAKWEAEQIAKMRAQGRMILDDGWREKYREPQEPDVAKLPELPKGWAWASIEQLSVVVRGASPRPAGDPRYFGGSIPWITVGSLTADETTPYLTSVSEFVTEAGRAASRYIEPDTLLLTNSGATLGVPKITLIGGCINDGSVALLHVDYPLKMYLYYFLASMTQKLRTINQGAAQPNLNTGIVKAITVPLPPLTEQQRIVAEVERRLSVVTEVEAAVAANLKRAERLRQAILKRAFEGKLVPQNPSDEPASVLLERIRKEREGQNAEKNVKQMRMEGM